MAPDPSNESAAQSGLPNCILVEWPGWSAMWLFGAGEKATQPCASAMCALDRTPSPLDSIDNTAVSIHRYLDKGTSGTSAECNPALTALAGRMPEFAAQVRKRHLRVVIGEFAGGSTQKVAASCVPVRRPPWRPSARRPTCSMPC